MERDLLAEKAKLASRGSARRVLVVDVPEDLFEEYERTASTRGGVAMAETFEERCQVRCGSCKRILYYREKEEAPV